MTNTTSATWLVPGLVDGSISAEPATVDMDMKKGKIESLMRHLSSIMFLTTTF